MLIVYNELNLLHKLTIKEHPQRPQRISQTIKYLKQTQFSQYIFTAQQLLKNQNKSEEEIQKIVLNQITKVHGQRYFDFIEGMWCEGISKPQMFINIDTYYMKQTFLSAFQAVKTGILAIQQSLMQNKLQKDVICLIRPPGHHSGMKNQPHGFSFFNNVAIAANYFVQKTNKKAVIIDWDIHHGQGTQRIFYDRGDVLYISLHRFDEGKFFPHVKQSGNTFLGQKQGKGFNINIAWNFPSKQKNQIRKDSETVRDKEYFYCLEKIVVPILRQFQFQAIFVSCGFDCAQGDPIGDSKITNDGFRVISSVLKSFKKPLYIFLEGGYNIHAIKHGIQAVLQGITHKSQLIPKVQFEQLNQFAKADIQSSIKGIKRYWKI